jgi:hypothetical protein
MPFLTISPKGSTGLSSGLCRALSLPQTDSAFLAFKEILQLARFAQTHQQSTVLSDRHEMEQLGT